MDVAGVVANYERLVFAARPRSEDCSLYRTLKAELKSRGFSVATVCVVGEQPNSFYAERAQEILRHLH